MKKYIQLIDNLNERIGKLVGWLTALMVGVVCIDVLLRYFLSHVFSVGAFLREVEWHLFSLIFLIGAGYALKHDRHVRVDIFYAQFRPKTKAWVNFLGTIFLLLPFCTVLIYASYPYIRNAFLMHEASLDPGGLPARWLIKSAIPMGMILLFLQGTSLICSSLLVILGKE